MTDEGMINTNAPSRFTTRTFLPREPQWQVFEIKLVTDQWHYPCGNLSLRLHGNSLKFG
jgi:hypothetical protein